MARQRTEKEPHADQGTPWKLVVAQDAQGNLVRLDGTKGRLLRWYGGELLKGSPPKSLQDYVYRFRGKWIQVTVDFRSLPNLILGRDHHHLPIAEYLTPGQAAAWFATKGMPIPTALSNPHIFGSSQPLRSKAMSRKHNPPADPPYHDDPLIGSRLVPRDAPTGTHWTQEALALYSLGFAEVWFLPYKLARRWRTSLYPRRNTAESIQRWQGEIERLAAAQQGAFREPNRAAETLADLEADQELIRQHNQASAVESKPATNATEQTSPQARATAFVIDRHKATGKVPRKEDIAKVAGVNRTTLHRSKDFAQLRAAIKAVKAGAAVPKGEKDADGNIDAYDD